MYLVFPEPGLWNGGYLFISEKYKIDSWYIGLGDSQQQNSEIWALCDILYDKCCIRGAPFYVLAIWTCAMLGMREGWYLQISALVVLSILAIITGHVNQTTRYIVLYEYGNIVS